MPPLFPVTLALYAVACTLYLAHLWVENTPVGSLQSGARIALGLAFASHAVDIGWLCLHGMHPVVNAREALSFVSWLMCGAFLLISFRLQVSIVGALVVPATMVLYVAARLSPSQEALHGSSLLGNIHVTLATAGVAIFAVAAGAAIIYLIEERNLKAHRPGRLSKHGSALMTLDTLNRRCILLGFPLFTVAMVTGALWAVRSHTTGLFSAQYAIATATWILYAGLLVARQTVGFRGRKAALVTLLGFATAMIVLLIYFARGVSGA